MSDFVSFILDEFIKNIDTNIYYDKYDNMDKEALYYYFKGKFEGSKEKEKEKNE